MAPSPKRRIFCLEGQWENDLEHRRSVLPTLDTLERLRVTRYIHRDVGTPEELGFYLGKWGERRYDRYEILYIASHGAPGAIQLGRHVVDLPELAECIGSAAAGRIIYFGSCSVFTSSRAVAPFQRETRARLVCGYRKQVGWVESAGFDLILLDTLASYTRVGSGINQLKSRYPDLTKSLGFATYSRADAAKV